MQGFLAKAFSPDRLKALAFKCGFITRERTLCAFGFLHILVFDNKAQDWSTLGTLKGAFMAISGKSISRAGLHKRFNAEAASFMESVLCGLMLKPLGKPAAKGALGAFFKSIHAKDSTKVTLPLCCHAEFPGFGGFGKKTSCMSIQLELNLLDCSWKMAKATRATLNDQADSRATLGDIQPGSLNLRDLGYVSLDYMRAADKKGAWYINKLQKVGVRELDGSPMDWGKLGERAAQAPGGILDMGVLLGTRNPVRSRIVARAVPKATAQGRIEKATKDGKRNKKGYTPSEELKTKAHFDIMATNIPRGAMPARVVFEAYRLRWQIECCFKSWKSVLGIDKVKKARSHRVACQILAKLIKAALFDKVLSLANGLAAQQFPRKACSRHKLHKQLEHNLSCFARAATQKDKFMEWVAEYLVPQIPDLLVESRLGEQTHYQIIQKLLKIRELRK